MNKRIVNICALICAVIIAAVSAPARPQGNINEQYEMSEQMIRMRDGVQLHTAVNVPRNVSGPLPFILVRTPYSIGRGTISSSYRELAEEGYIFVFQDIRGRYGSEGQFVMMRPARDRGDPDSIDEGTDTYDTIEWLIENVPDNNGRVGIMGISYGGWLTVMAMLEPHPALKAVSPQASPADMYLGDDFLHNGALRLSPAFGYSAMMESGTTNMPFDFDQYDAYEWYLDLGPLSTINEKYVHGRLPSWNNFMAHPNYDDYWKEISVITYLR